VTASPSIRREPVGALIAEEQGLALYRQLFEQLSSLKTPFAALCEIDPDQTKAITSLIKKNHPQAEISIKKDLAGKARLVIAKTLTK
jgi:methylase of polypeptide subunit release factors